MYLGACIVVSALTLIPLPSVAVINYPPRIATLVDAKLTCKISESVCGVIHGSALQFNCVDTRSTLNSCGGCIVPHPFYEPYRTTSKGIECDRLPGVVLAHCRDSRCFVSHCTNGLQPSIDSTKCVPISLAEKPLREGMRPILHMRYKRQTVPTNLVPSADLISQIKELVAAIVELNALVKSLPTSNITAPQLNTSAQNVSAPGPQSFPTPQNVTGVVDITRLNKDIVAAVTNLVKANTVSEVVDSITAVTTSLHVFKSMLDSCGCVQDLGLEQVLAKLNVANEIAATLLNWLAVNPVALPQLPSTALPSLLPVPIPNTSDLPIDLGLAGLADTLDPPVTPLIPPITTPLTPNLITRDVSVKDKVTALVNAVMNLTTAISSNFSTTTQDTSHVAVSDGTNLPLDTTLADPVVQAAIDFTASPNATAALSNINTLVAANAALASALAAFNIPPTPDIGGIISILNTVSQLSLDIEQTVSTLSTLPLPFGLGSVLVQLVGVLPDPVSILSSIDGQRKVSHIVGLVVGLQQQISKLPTLTSVPSSPSPGLPGGNILGSIVRAVTQLLGALGFGDFLSDLEVLVETTGDLESTLTGCGCTKALGLEGVANGAGEVKTKIMELKEAVETIHADPDASGEKPLVRNAGILIQVLNFVSLNLL